MAFERGRITGAIRTAFILSAEIIVITLGVVAGKPLLTQLATANWLLALTLAADAAVGLCAGFVIVGVKSLLPTKPGPVIKSHNRCG